VGGEGGKKRRGKRRGRDVGQRISLYGDYFSRISRPEGKKKNCGRERRE